METMLANAWHMFSFFELDPQCSHARWKNDVVLYHNTKALSLAQSSWKLASKTHTHTMERNYHKLRLINLLGTCFHETPFYLYKLDIGPTCTPKQWLGRLLDIIGWDPSVCKTNWLRKEKVTPVSRYRRECEPISIMLITGVRDAT